MIEQDDDAGAGSLRPWDQQPGETDKSYTRFVFYLNCGPMRDYKTSYDQWVIAGASALAKRDTYSAWRQHAHKNKWAARARAYDVDLFSRQGFATVAKFMAALSAAAQKLNDAIANDKRVTPRSWYEAINGLSVVGSFIPAETVAGLSDRPGAVGDPPPAIGTIPGGPSNDYRAVIAALEAGSIADNHPSGETQNSDDGPPLGKDNDG